MYRLLRLKTIIATQHTRIRSYRLTYSLSTLGEQSNLEDLMRHRYEHIATTWIQIFKLKGWKADCFFLLYIIDFQLVPVPSSSLFLLVSPDLIGAMQLLPVSFQFQFARS